MYEREQPRVSVGYNAGGSAIAWGATSALAGTATTVAAVSFTALKPEPPEVHWHDAHERPVPLIEAVPIALTVGGVVLGRAARMWWDDQAFHIYLPRRRREASGDDEDPSGHGGDTPDG